MFYLYILFVLLYSGANLSRLTVREYIAEITIQFTLTFDFETFIFIYIFSSVYVEEVLADPTPQLISVETMLSLPIFKRMPFPRSSPVAKCPSI